MLLRCAAIALLASSGTLAHAQRCPLTGPKTPEPAWVSNTGTAPDGALHGIGVTEVKRNTPLDEARKQARASALADLAQQIAVDVRTQITNSTERVVKDGKSTSRQEFNFKGEVQSRLELRSTEVVEQWSDQSNCRLWMRVRMPRGESEQARREATSDAAVASMRGRLLAAANNALPTPERQAALAEAQELASLADPSLTSGFSRDAFELQRVELAATLIALQQRENGYRADITAHVQSIARATAATNAIEKREAQQQSLRTLDRALTAFPQGVPGYTTPFAPAERMATLYAELGMTCSGRQWFERRNLALPAQLTGATCDGNVLAREHRTQYLSGKTIQINCSLRVGGGAQSAWPKACSELQAKLAADGAVAAPQGAAAQVRIELRAEGEVEERKDAESGRASWRFRGKISSVVQGPEALEIVDSYDTQTGWDFVGAGYQTDRLAVLVAGRLDSALTANLGK